MKPIRVAIADDNIRLVEILEEVISSDPDLEVVGTAHNGEDILSIIREKEPDVVLLDIIMPRLDGLSVMERLSAERLTDGPSIIVMSAIGREQIAEDAFQLGAAYYILKPFDNQVLLNRIKTICGGQAHTALTYNTSLNTDPLPAMVQEESGAYTGDRVEVDVTEFLRSIGVPAHIKGYQYMKDAIAMAIRDISVMECVTKTLYPNIAEKYGTTSSRVERAIRHGIELGMSRGKIDVLENFFGYTVNGGRGKPTNSEFMAQAADRLRLQYKI